MSFRTFGFAAAGFALLVSSRPCPAQDAFLTAEIWVESDAIPGNDLPAARSQAAELWEHARWLFSGMLYGFDFEYVPYDKTRKVDEIFAMQAKGSLPWGDSRLRCGSVRADGNRSFARFELGLDVRLAGLSSSWNALSSRACAGTGWAAMPPSPLAPAAPTGGPPPETVDVAAFGEDGIPALELIGASFPATAPDPPSARYVARVEATRIACREAIRACLRPELRNKPRLVRGSFAFAEAPRIVYRSGGYSVVVKLRVIIAEVIPYLLY